MEVGLNRQTREPWDWSCLKVDKTELMLGYDLSTTLFNMCTQPKGKGKNQFSMHYTRTPCK